VLYTMMDVLKNLIVKYCKIAKIGIKKFVNKLVRKILYIYMIKHYTYFFLQYISILINNNLGIFQIWDGQWSHLLQTIVYLKWLRSLKMNFIVGFPPEIQDSFVIKHVPSNARVFGYLDLKFHNLPAFGLKIRKIYRKYAKRGQVVKHL